MRTIFPKLKFGICKPHIFITAEVNTVMTSNKEIGRKLLKTHSVILGSPYTVLLMISKGSTTPLTEGGANTVIFMPENQLKSFVQFLNVSLAAGPMASW